MHRLIPWLFRFCCVMLFVHSLLRFIDFLQDGTTLRVFDSSITVREIEAAINFCVVMVVVAIAVTSVRWRRDCRRTSFTPHPLSRTRKWEIFLLALLSLWPKQVATAPGHLTSDEVPVRRIADPLLAAGILHGILRQRRQQIHRKLFPERLTEEQASELYQLKNQSAAVSAPFVVESDSDVVRKEVERFTESSDVFSPQTSVQMWDAVVRLYGYPLVQNSLGVTAQFGKSRSIEVLAWLAMNSDRARRSSVRTAVWEIDISDSSFSTVLSDARRGLNGIAPSTSTESWIPPTFTDEIQLGRRLISDYDLLSTAYQNFLGDSTTADELARELSCIRDIPFAGANYLWADLDGTTTRLVVMAVQASIALANWARDKNETEVFLLAVRAGLRVLPGCDELLELQQSFISQSGLSSRRKIAR